MPRIVLFPLQPYPAHVVEELQPKRSGEKIGTKLRQLDPKINIVIERLIPRKPELTIAPQIIRCPQELRLEELKIKYPNAFPP